MKKNQALLGFLLKRIKRLFYFTSLNLFINLLVLLPKKNIAQKKPPIK